MWIKTQDGILVNTDALVSIFFRKDGGKNAVWKVRGYERGVEDSCFIIGEYATEDLAQQLFLDIEKGIRAGVKCMGVAQ